MTVTLKQKAQVGDRARSDFVLGTHTHLPGAVIRGAFAARWLATHQGRTDASSEHRQEFLALFEGDVRYGPLFHTNPPTPLSVLGHKYLPRPDCDYDDIDRATVEWEAVRCPQCQSPLEPIKTDRDSGSLTGRRIHVKVGDAGVAERGQLVTRETLRPHLSFTGTVHTDDPALLDRLAGLGHIRVGGRRTTHGLADVSIDHTFTPPVPQRRDDGRLVLTLQSPGLFVDDLGRPIRDPNPGELRDVLGCHATVEHQWTRWTTVGGWHAASGLPKPTELAVAAGSTYLIAPSHPIDDSVLVNLAHRGLGLRRHEGFGDLGTAPILRPGRLAREAEQRRIADIRGKVAALTTFSTHNERWQLILILLSQVADRQPDATERLTQLAARWPSPQRRAAQAFIGMDTADARLILDEWSRR